MKKLALLAALAAFSASAYPETKLNFVSGSDKKANNNVSGTRNPQADRGSSRIRRFEGSEGVPITAGELDISSPILEHQGLKSFAVTDIVTGAKFKVYFDAASEIAAKEAIPILASMYRDVAQLLDLPADQIKWFDVMLARNSHKLVVANKPWDIDVDAKGRLNSRGLDALYKTIPHEQVHSTQSGIAKIPRWYTEGQATWVEIRVAEKWAPELALAARKRQAEALAESKTPLALNSWGGIVVKKEAILRQITPEQRAKFEKDSIPPSGGHFFFRPEDTISDESNSTARYAASFGIFALIEKKAGLDALQAWFKAVRETEAPITNDALVASAKTHTKIDISDDIK